MKYTLNLNLKALYEVAPILSLKEAAILEFIKGMCTTQSTKMSRIKLGGKIYTWISYSHVLSEMPILGIKTKGGINHIIKKLEEEKFIISYIDVKQRKKYISLLPKIDLLDWSDGLESLSTVNDPLSTVNDPLSTVNDPFSTVNLLYNKHNNIKLENKEQQAAAKKIPNSSPKNISSIRLSSIPEKVVRNSGVASLTKDEKVVLKEYKKLIFKNCSDKTPAVKEYLPESLKIFKQYYPEKYVSKFIEALNNFANDDWCKSLKLDMKKKAILSPSRFLKPKFIENNILPFVSDNPTANGNSSKDRYSEEELREAEEFNRESLRKFKEKAIFNEGDDTRV